MKIKSYHFEILLSRTFLNKNSPKSMEQRKKSPKNLKLRTLFPVTCCPRTSENWDFLRKFYFQVFFRNIFPVTLFLDLYRNCKLFFPNHLKTICETKTKMQKIIIFLQFWVVIKVSCFAGNRVLLRAVRLESAVVVVFYNNVII